MSDLADKAKVIFLDAIEKYAPEQWACYLDEACAGDGPLRARVDRLLRARAQLGSFHEAPKPSLVATTDEPLTERPGTLIGPYKLMEQIGEGGMGLVFVAEQQQPVRRKVALKVIKPGMDTREVIARFEAERQALALMEHPHIARVLDAGATASGRPYFVMELVKGVPITQFCDDNRLTPRQRLELFLSVCQAVQHAHQKGIIHRHVKPSNVLVTSHDGTPVVKVIDFGVAKAVGQQLTEKTLYTGFAQMIGTPLYMSPEQAGMSGLDVDTRTDLYALGVLLYELLTGTTPFEGARLRQAGYDEIRRIIREEEPVKPSTRISTLGQAATTVSGNRQSDPKKLGQLMRGELDWIVMKALEKDRNRRYETASAFAADVQRYLHDEPVQACPPSARYRLRKFVRKHKTWLATAAAFAALLLLGVAASTWQAWRATQAEALAIAAEAVAIAERDDKEQARQAEAEQRAEAQQQRDAARALNERLQRTLYAAHMNLAHNAWETPTGAERVRQLLEQHRPQAGETDLRGFEWYYLYRLCHTEILTLQGHTRDVLTLAYSPDGKRLASGSGHESRRAPGEVKVWDAQTGQELRVLQGHSNRVSSVAFSPDGKRLASASGDNTVKVWDPQTGQELLTFREHSRPVTSVAFSPDGKRLASASSDKTVKVWDARTGQELFSLQGHTDDVNSVVFSPDGKRLASASDDQTVKVWEAQTGQELLTLKGHTNLV